MIRRPPQLPDGYRIVEMYINSGLRAFVCISVLWCAVVMGQDEAGRVPLYVEYSPAAQELVDRALRLHEQDRFADAAQVYQQILEQYHRKLVSHDGGVHVDTTVWTRNQLLSDADLLAAYRGLYEPNAQHGLEQASRSRVDTSALEELLGRYPVCDAALEAGLRLAAVYLEQGHFSFAGSVLEEIRLHPSLRSQMARWHELQAAVGLFENDTQRYRSHLDAARGIRSANDKSDDQSSIEALKRWSRHLRPPVSPIGSRYVAYPDSGRDAGLTQKPTMGAVCRGKPPGPGTSGRADPGPAILDLIHSVDQPEPAGRRG